MGAVGSADLAHGCPYVFVDGALGYVKDFPNLPGRFSPGNPDEDLSLTTSKNVEFISFRGCDFRPVGGCLRNVIK
jgi:hypothetical protein